MKYKLSYCDRCGTDTHPNLFVRKLFEKNEDSPYYCRDCWVYAEKKYRGLGQRFFDVVIYKEARILKMNEK